MIPSNKPEYVVSAIEKASGTPGMVPAEIWLPQQWRDAVIARGETLQDAAQEAFRLLNGTLGENARETALRSNSAHQTFTC